MINHVYDILKTEYKPHMAKPPYGFLLERPIYTHRSSQVEWAKWEKDSKYG
jgi:hypothetical protein